jgi:hypothetical protein
MTRPRLTPACAGCVVLLWSPCGRGRLLPSVPVTYGWELFGGERYTPLGDDPATVTEQTRAQLLVLL